MGKFKNYITLLLATYLFALMVLPCNDSCSSDGDKKTKTFDTAQEHHDEDKDVCSPFCFCSCCAAAMITFQFKDFNFIPTYFLRYFSALEHVFFPKVNCSIWQPPKLG